MSGMKFFYVPIWYLQRNTLSTEDMVSSSSHDLPILEPTVHSPHKIWKPLKKYLLKCLSLGKEGSPSKITLILSLPKGGDRAPSQRFFFDNFGKT